METMDTNPEIEEITQPNGSDEPNEHMKLTDTPNEEMDTSQSIQQAEESLQEGVEDLQNNPGPEQESCSSIDELGSSLSNATVEVTDNVNLTTHLDTDQTSKMISNEKEEINGSDEPNKQMKLSDTPNEEMDTSQSIQQAKESLQEGEEDLQNNPGPESCSSIEEVGSSNVHLTTHFDTDSKIKSNEKEEINEKQTNAEENKKEIVVTQVSEETVVPGVMAHDNSRRNKNKRKKLLKQNRSNKMPKIDDVNICKKDKPEEIVEYYLNVYNLPNSWSFMEIKNYIDTECGPVDEIEMLKDDETGNGAIRLSYETEDDCLAAMKKLKDKDVAGNKLTMKMFVESFELEDTPSEASDVSCKLWRPDMDSWDVDPTGRYGLKLSFLRSLGITPPLDKWVHVSNFRCDKSELRDVLEMAGNVQMCCVFHSANKYANVMYSHPLEAVQAVSMIDNQVLYGLPIRVKMDRSPANTIILPKGLTNIGHGLGSNGKPLRNIVKHYQRFVDDKHSLVSPVCFDIPENHSMLINPVAQKLTLRNVEEFNKTLDNATLNKTNVNVTPVKSQQPAFTVNQGQEPVNPHRIVNAPVNMSQQNYQRAPFPVPFRGGPVINEQAMVPRGPIPMRPMVPQSPIGQQVPMGQLPHMGPQVPMGNIQPQIGQQGPMGQMQPQMGPQGPMGQMQPQMGPQGPMGQMQPQMGPQGPRGHMPSMSPMGPQGYGRPGPVGPSPGWNRPLGPSPMFNEPVKLLFSNLPLSTSFTLLCEKMSSWGHVLCLQLTKPGSAVVTFANSQQAEACMKHFNGRNIENHFVRVTVAN